MAHPPPTARTAPTLSQEQQREALQTAHDATVAELERCLDLSIRGKLRQHTAAAPLALSLPIGSHTPQVLADLRAHYVAAGWARADTDEQAASDRGPAVAARTLTLTPAS